MNTQKLFLLGLVGTAITNCAPVFSLSSSTSSLSSEDNLIITEGLVTAETNFFNLFDDSIHHRIVITTTTNELNLLDQHMQSQFDMYGHYKSSVYQHADFDYYEDGVLTKSIDDVGIRVHGNIFSRFPLQYADGQMNPAHFRLSFDETFDMVETSEEYATRKKRDLFSLENLVLKWNKTSLGTPYEFDPYITEEYSYQLFEDAGLYSPRASLVQFDMIIDGQLRNLGVYSMFEPLDENFIEKRFAVNEASGNLYKALWQNGQASLLYTDSWLFGVKNEEQNYFPAYDIKTNEDTNNGDDLKNFITTYQSLSGTELYDYLQETIDLDQWLRFQTLDYLLGNPDTFRYDTNNYYVYFTSGSNPKLIWMPTDYDKALGVQDWNPDGSMMRNILPYDSWTAQEWVTTPLLIQKTLLSGDERYEDPYEVYLSEFVSTFFTYNKWLNHYYQASSLYNSSSLTINGLRWGPKPMGRPNEIQSWFCNQTYKATHITERAPDNQC